MGITLKLAQAQTYLKLGKPPHLQSMDETGFQGSGLCSEHKEETLMNQNLFNAHFDTFSFHTRSF